MKHRINNDGMTMIELVSALMLFIIILGGLTLALNKTTSLWSSAHTQQNEQEQADLVLNMLTDDLRQAVADTGTNNSSSIMPTFICDASTNQTKAVETLLQFVRHRPEISSFNTNDSEPPFLDAVFYTCYNDKLFRHIAPLTEYNDSANPETIGKLLKDKYLKISTEQIHKDILAYLNDPVNNTKPSPFSPDPYNFSLIASFIEQPYIRCGIRISLTTNDEKTDAPVIDEQMDNIQITTPPIYNRFATTALPDYIDIKIRIFSKSGWNTYLDLFRNGPPDLYERKNPYLGTYRSKCIYMPTARGARLP